MDPRRDRSAAAESEPSARAHALYQQTLEVLQRGDDEGALTLCRQALLEVGGHGPLRNNLALVLKRLHCPGESEAVLRALVADQPSDSDAWSNLAEVCKAQGKLDEAVAALRRALACPGSHRSVHDNLLLLLQYLPQLSRADLAAEHRRYGERFPPVAAAAHGNSVEPERPLRIGYLSPDIRRHAAARFLEPMLRARDRHNFRVILYGELQDLDAVSQRLIGLADGWCCTLGLSREQLARRIRHDRIDLLVDLAGHTAGNRLDVLPLRPAPLQFTTLGYPDSTGLTGLDGRISDAILDLPGEEPFSSEPLLRLAGSFCCFQPPPESPGLMDPPCLSGAPLRLLSPHQLFKLNEPLLRLWARLLERLPDAELVLLRSSLTPPNQAAMRERLQRCGIDPVRVRMERPLSDERAYLETIGRCDLMLDAWPHNGHTTTCEALWMGLPVITRRGDRPCGRLAASVLSALGRPGWIADDEEGYLEAVVNLAGNREGLRAARFSLRDEMAASVADASAHMARLEALYRRVWRQWCRSRQVEMAGAEAPFTSLPLRRQDVAYPTTGAGLPIASHPPPPSLRFAEDAASTPPSASVVITPQPQSESIRSGPAAANGLAGGSTVPGSKEAVDPSGAPVNSEALQGRGDVSGDCGADTRIEVPVSYEHSADLPALLERLELSLLLSTYQAGRVVSIGSHQGQLRIGFSHFDQAMGMCRTDSGLAVGSRDSIWMLPANREIASRIAPAGEHDIAFLARSCHHTGPLMGHDLAWAAGRLWLVNTLFNGLVTIEGDWSFVPQWQPPFISGWAPGDRCHLNGLAMTADGSAPAWVTVLGETDSEGGWREQKASGGCLLHVPSGASVLRGLSMPHSPRLYQGQLYLLDSGRGSLIRVDPATGSQATIAILPGFTRGLDCYAGYAFVGLSRIRETAVFGGLPLQQSGQELRCGLAIVNLTDGAVEGLLWLHSGVEEVFAVVVLPGWRNPTLIGPDTRTDDCQTVWLVPPGR